MTALYQLTKDECYGNCKVTSEGAFVIDVTYWFENKVLDLGPYKVKYPYDYPIYETGYMYDGGWFDPFMTTSVFSGTTTFPGYSYRSYEYVPPRRRTVEIVIYVGERKAIAVPRRKGDIYIYVENVTKVVKRKEIDYKKYMEIMGVIKAVRLKKVVIQDMLFKNGESKIEVYDKDGKRLYYEYNEEFIRFTGGRNVPIYTKDGLEHLRIDGETKFNIGECLVATIKGEIMCFGDPK